MKLKTDRSFWKDFLLSLVTLGIWGIIVRYLFIEESKVFYKKAKPLYIVLSLIPYVGIVFTILYLIDAYKILEERSQLMKINKKEPQTTFIRLILSQIFGIFTLFIWPIIEGINLYDLWNESNFLYNLKKDKLR